ncbi:MAG TPA: hypothetical protein PKY05_04825, partial [Fibrobacteria bacterium]|nr:hypothetical protein [Fibrobacteria bacterium]
MIPFLIASILPLATGAQVEWRPGDLPTQARFSQPAGHLQPATARMFSVFASNADSLSLDILAAAPESLVARGDHGVFRSIGHRGFRRRSAEAGNWERPLNLDSIRSVHGGAVLRIAATAHGPRGNASIQGTWSIGSLEVIGLRTEDAFEDLAISDPSTVRPVARAVVHLCDSASSAGCIQSATDDRGFAHLAAPSGHWRAMVRNGLDVLVLGHDLAHSITPAAVSIPSPTTGWSSWKREFHDPPSPRAHGRGQSPQPGSGKGYRIHPYLARGVHRPGDSIVVGCLVRAPGGSLPTPHSLEVTLRHDTTLLVDSARASSGLEGHYQVRMALPRNIPGGTWTLWTRFDGDTSDSIVFRVETDPPRKVSVDLQDSVLMDSPTIVARLSAKWLSGRSAVGLTGRIRIVRTEKKTRGYTPGNYNSGDWILSQYRRGGPSELRLDTTFESFLDDAGRMEVRLPLHWNPYGWREAAYTLSAEVFAPGGEAIDPVERKGSIEWGREPFLHVFCDSVETILTPLMLTWAGHVALAGVPLHLRIHDPLTGSVLLDTTMESSTSIRVPTSLWVGSTPDSPLRLGRFFQANLRVVSDSSAWSSFEIETGRTRSGWWGLPRHLDQRAQSRWVLHPKPAAPSAPSSPRTATATAPRFSAPQETPSPNDAMSPGRPPLEVCWESLPGTLSLVQVTQGRRLLHQEWVRGGKDSTCWKREPPAHWWPSVVVSVHALHGSVDSGMAVQHRGERFQVSAPRGRISIAVRPLSHFQPNSVQRVRVVNHSRIAGSVVVSAIDRGTLDLDGHRTRNPAPTLEADDPPTDSWWTSIAKATDPTDAPVFHSYRTLGSHG